MTDKARLFKESISRRVYVESLPYPDWNFQEESVDDKIFIPNLAIEITKIEAKKLSNSLREFYYPYLYTITINHGSIFEWKIDKCYKDFLRLHKTLLNYVQTYRKEWNDHLNISQTIVSEEEEQQQPCFPIDHDRQSSCQERCQMLKTYLNQTLKHPKFREQQVVKTFLEVSPLSFLEGFGQSFKEGDLSKRSKIDQHPHFIFFRIPFLFDQLKSDQGRRWFVIKDSYVVYMQTNSPDIGFPMLIDEKFSIDRSHRKTRTKHGIRIKNSQGLMILKCHQKIETMQWFEALQKIKTQSIFAQLHDFQSFAPNRCRQYAQWFINGQSYMQALVKAILAAREEIFIADWWLSPELMLIRPIEGDSMRLDNLLSRRAEEGIRIYILLYKDMKSMMGLNSRHSKRQLICKEQGKNNIKIIRHPDHKLLSRTRSSFFYSNHEKIVIIDQRLAFIGGIDLCWGRWDDENYRLVDLGDENITELKTAEELADEYREEEDKEKMVLGVKINIQESINSRKVPINERQLEHEYGRYETHWMRRLMDRETFDDDSTDDEEEEEEEESNSPIASGTQGINNPHRFFIGKDYANYYKKDFESVEKFDEDYLDRKTTPRLPWHDEALVVTGEAARDCARHFIQRWNTYKRDKYRFDVFYPYLLPKTYDDRELNDQSLLHSILPEDRPAICVDAQCVRSASFWSCGVQTVERSVQDAYIHMIDCAEHFIYIENQFFITIEENPIIENQLAEAFFRRIIRANINREKFRIYVVLPLLPAFANSNALRAVLHFMMKSINKGEKSLYQRLKLNGVANPEEYITFYGMRNWDILMGKLVTEIIYVHAKLMIVDDRMCICGSANINDRSLRGSRDSEICLIVHDSGEEKVGTFCSTWRKKLFRHLLGLKEEEEINIDDPSTDEFYEYFRRIARRNTEIYEEVFHSIPTNQIRQFDDIKAYVQQSKLKRTDPQTAHEKCKQIQGFLVEYPIDFLADDVIMPEWNTSERIAPVPLWT